MNKYKMDLEMFGTLDDRDFFTTAFEEANNISDGDNNTSETPSEPIEAPVSDSEPTDVETPNETPNEPYNPNDEELIKLYKERFGEPKVSEENNKTEYDKETQSAIDLYKYLEENPHLVQAMRDVDKEGYKQLNNFVPDELTKKVKEMEEYIEERKYNDYINELKSKYSDFDEDKVLEYASEHDVLNLEVAYKAMKSESIKEPNIDELRKQIKEELLNELKQNSLETQSIVGGLSQKPMSQDTSVKLSNREGNIARAFGMSPTEYTEWKNKR